ncbi:MAG: hypothetical protein NT031_12175 [Planctomycetota bacterium]|nr:hypothetical protein [Planctomycetota bacterium]
MNDDFAKRVRAAAVAGWWTLLIAAIFLTLQWGLYMAISACPAKACWLTRLWGRGVEWQTIQTMWLWMFAALKLAVWILALPVIWLTIWARALRKG